MGNVFGNTLGTWWEHIENKGKKNSLSPHPLKKKLDLSPIDNKFPLISIGLNTYEVSWEKTFKKTWGILENGTPMLVGIPIFKTSCKSFTICKCNSKYTKNNVRGFYGQKKIWWEIFEFFSNLNLTGSPFLGEIYHKIGKNEHPNFEFPNGHGCWTLVFLVMVSR